jgi:PKD repeat protein
VLDQNLDTVWGIGQTVSSTSTDGRYAFSPTAIYDVNLRRQILSMPATTSVSGYNSTSEKLIVQVGSTLGFYPLSTPITIPAPVLSAGSTSYVSIDLNWTDKSLEMEFIVQQRLLGASTWTDVQTTSANVISWTATGLQEGWTYEYRVRASSTGYSSPWSNIVSATVLQSNVRPLAQDTAYTSHFTASLQGTLSATDPQGFSLSYYVYQQPQYGSVEVNADTGGFTYTPSGTYTGSVAFQFYASNVSTASIPATVTIDLTNTTPVAADIEFESFVDTPLATIIVASDADGDALTYELLGNVSTGQVSLSNNGLFGYTAIETASHVVTVPYRVSDGQAWSNTGQITLRIHGSAAGGYSPIYLTRIFADEYAGIAAHGVNFSVSVLGGTESYEYLWDFGDGVTSSEQNPGHTFMMPGEYTVRLLVIDQNDSVNTASGELKILVLSEPSELNVDFTSSADVGSRQAVFNISIDGDESPYTLEINYGDGDTEFATVTTSAHTFEHSYAEFGSYVVGVSVTSQSGVGFQQLSIASGALVLKENSSNQGESAGSTSLLMLLMLGLMSLFRKTRKTLNL